MLTTYLCFFLWFILTSETNSVEYEKTLIKVALYENRSQYLHISSKFIMLSLDIFIR